jgi:hypothetical protein
MRRDYILTSYLPSGNGGVWWVDEKGHGFLSPITIRQLTIPAFIGDKITIETKTPGNADKVYVNGKLAFKLTPNLKEK